MAMSLWIHSRQYTPSSRDPLVQNAVCRAIVLDFVRLRFDNSSIVSDHQATLSDGDATRRSWSAVTVTTRNARHHVSCTMASVRWIVNYKDRLVGFARCTYGLGLLHVALITVSRRRQFLKLLCPYVFMRTCRKNKWNLPAYGRRESII